jgi:heme-degrading monooxygenase HmoA
MRDFDDFLKRKLVHVAIGEFKPGKFAEAQQLYEQAVATYGHGFQGAYLFQEPGSDRGISIIFWDNMGDMDMNQTQTEHQEILKKMVPLFATTPQTTVYELVSETTPATAILVSSVGRR